MPYGEVASSDTKRITRIKRSYAQKVVPTKVVVAIVVILTAILKRESLLHVNFIRIVLVIILKIIALASCGTDTTVVGTHLLKKCKNGKSK